MRRQQNRGDSGDFRVVLDALAGTSQSAQTPLPGWHQAAPDQVQVGQRKGGEQARRVLGEAAVAHFSKAPEAFDDMKGVLAARSCARSAAVDRPLGLGEWIATIGSAVHTVADAALLGGPAMIHAPIGLIPVQGALLAVQKLG